MPKITQMVKDAENQILWQITLRGDKHDSDLVVQGACLSVCVTPMGHALIAMDGMSLSLKPGELDLVTIERWKAK